MDKKQLKKFQNFKNRPMNCLIIYWIY